MAQVTELVTKFSFTGSTAPLRDYNNALGSSVTLLASVTAALVASSAAVSKWASGILENLDPLEQLSRRSRVAVEEIEELTFVAGQFGAGAGAVTGTITGLSAAIGQAAEQGSAAFSRLGISVRDANGELKGADTILEEVRQRFSQMNMDIRQQETLAAGLGIDPSLVQMLNATNSEMETLRQRARDLGRLTGEQAEDAAQYTAALREMRFGMTSLKNFIAVGLAPELTRLSARFLDTLASSRDFIVGGVQGLMTFTGNLIDALRRLTPVLALVGIGFLTLKVQAIGLGVVLATVFSPVLLITAAIVGLLLIIDDLIVAFRGGQSVIADFFQEFFGIDIQPALQAVVGQVVGAMSAITDVVGHAWDMVRNLFLGVASLLEGDINGMVEFFMAAFGNFGDMLTRILQTAVGDAVAWIENQIMEMVDGLTRQIRAMIDGFLSGVDRVRNVANLIPGVNIGGGDSGPGLGVLPGITPASLTPQGRGDDNRSVNQDVRIDVRSSDPERAGVTIRNRLNNQLQDANTQLGVGGF